VRATAWARQNSKAQLKTFGVEITLEEAQRIIDTYRATYPKIPLLWKAAANILPAIIREQTTEFGRNGLLEVDGSEGILLPNGLRLKYPNLRQKADEETGKVELVYDTKKGKAIIPNRIYGGKVVENVCQALARIVIGEQMLMIAKKYRVVMTVHDSIIVIAPEAEAERAQEYVELCMRLRPCVGIRTAPQLPKPTAVKVYGRLSMAWSKEDLTAKQFGRLFVVCKKPVRGSKWICFCDCGVECEVLAGHLTGGIKNLVGV
jgi:hypothetical protein